MFRLESHMGPCLVTLEAKAFRGAAGKRHVDPHFAFKAAQIWFDGSRLLEESLLVIGAYRSLTG